MQQMLRASFARLPQGKSVIIQNRRPSEGGRLRGAFSSEEMAVNYFINTQAVGSKAILETFYFSSLMSLGKQGDGGDVGAYWGLLDKNEKKNYLLTID